MVWFWVEHSDIFINNSRKSWVILTMLYKQSLIAILLGIVLTTTVLANTKQENIIATKINTFKPTVTPTKTKHGSCWTNAIAAARKDAWRCTVGNNIYDPCFSLESKKTVICDADPINKNPGFLLKLTQPLPKLTPSKNPKTNPWIIELADGTICYPYTGTMPIIHHGKEIIALQYGCRNLKNKKEEGGLLENSITPGKIWRTKQVFYDLTTTKPKLITIKNATIKAVWQ